MLKALLRARHLQNYGMFKRAYQKAARGLDKELVETYPSKATLYRWLAGQIQDLPHPDHCAVLEAMLPGWTAAELFKPYGPPESVEGSTLLRELLRRRCLHNYQEFCRAYDLAAATIDTKLVGGHPAQRQFHRWICGESTELPHPEHCAVLEVLFPEYSARQLFEMAEPPEAASPEEPATAARNGRPEMSGTAGSVMPDEASVSVVTALTALALPDHVVASLLHHLESLTSSLATPQERARAYHQLVQLLRRWAHTMDRRGALQFLYRAALAASAAATLDWDEHERVTSVLIGSSRVDTQTIENFETILQSCKQQDDVLGPSGILDTVLIQRDLLHSLRPDCPAELRPQLLSVLSIASGAAGWFSFNLNDDTSTAGYYEDARMLAHEAGNIELAAKALAFMSGLTTSQGKPRIGIDHAVAAQQWASRSGDMRLRALCADEAAQAYAADGQREACLAALDTAAAACESFAGQPQGRIRFTAEVHLHKRAQCHLDLGDADQAADFARRSLATVDPAFPRDMALTTVDLARAYARSGEVNESARMLGEAADIAARHTSTRLIIRVQQARTELQPWQGINAVRELDDRLTTYGLA
ncbi:MAG: hypothetical protein ACRDRH_00490 [Pseudonocardia sp.]